MISEGSRAGGKSGSKDHGAGSDQQDISVKLAVTMLILSPQEWPEGGSYCGRRLGQALRARAKR